MLFEEAFSSFPSLQELKMPVNALCGLNVNSGHFLQLKVLMQNNGIQQNRIDIIGSISVIILNTRFFFVCLGAVE